MNLERLPEKLTIATVLLVGAGVAAYAGKLTGEGQGKMILILLLAFAIVVLSMKWGKQSWLLIPVFSGFMGTIPALPVPFALRDLVILYVFGVFLVFKALKLVRTKPETGLVDLFLLINLVWLGQAFMRNPVGFSFMDSPRIGGRPYFDVAIACAGYWVLTRVRLETTLQAVFLPLWMMLGPVVDAFTGAVAQFRPEVGDSLSPFYSGFGTGVAKEVQAMTQTSQDVEDVRSIFLINLGRSVFYTACSFWHPMTCINPLYIWRFVALLSGSVFILLTGFRAGIISATAFFLLAGYFRSGWSHVFRCGVLGIPALVLLIVGQGTLYQLPFAAQRALSFLPGHWDTQAVSAAQSSTEWRVEMWKDALTTDIYIKNKLLGDGFGVDKAVQDAMTVAVLRGINQRIQAEGQAILGGFHSGPISTIRFVGYLGLVLFSVLLIMVARLAWTQVHRARKTPYFPLALLVGIPAVYLPFHFFLLFGGYDTDFPRMIINLGMLHMLRRSLDEYHAEKSVSQFQSPSQQQKRTLRPIASAHV